MKVSNVCQPSRDGMETRNKNKFTDVPHCILCIPIQRVSIKTSPPKKNKIVEKSVESLNKNRIKGNKTIQEFSKGSAAVGVSVG